MVEKLRKLLESSYSPYSHFQVACVVTMNDGKEFYGVNVENASYGSAICAERNAITNAITHGYGPYDFESLDIMVSGDQVSTCCFMCRQVIVEFFEEDKIITCYNKEGACKKFTVKELCPEPFSKGDLK